MKVTPCALVSTQTATGIFTSEVGRASVLVRKNCYFIKLSIENVNLILATPTLYFAPPPLPSRAPYTIMTYRNCFCASLWCLPHMFQIPRRSVPARTRHALPKAFGAHSAVGGCVVLISVAVAEIPLYSSLLVRQSAKEDIDLWRS